MSALSCLDWYYKFTNVTIKTTAKEKHLPKQRFNKTFNISHKILSTLSTNEFEFTNLKPVCNFCYIHLMYSVIIRTVATSAEKVPEPQE